MLGSINVAQMVTVALNLIILYLFMRKFLFKPVTAYMENRSNSIRDSMDAADKAQADALELKSQYEAQLKAAKTEAARITDEARERSGREYDQMIASAKKDAESIMVKAREAIDRERAEMLREVKNQVAALALAAASKVIEANMDTESNRALVSRFIDEEGAA